MVSAEVSNAGAGGTPPVIAGEMRLEVVVLSVSDVDRAKRFYEGLGWRLDADLTVESGYRVVQLTPPGSACSIIFGEGVTSAPPGSASGLQLTVYDIDEARAELLGRGVEVSEPFHDVTGVFHHAGSDGTGQRAGSRACRLRLVRGLQRSGRQRLATPGDQDAASGPLRGGPNVNDL